MEYESIYQRLVDKDATLGNEELAFFLVNFVKKEVKCDDDHVLPFIKYMFEDFKTKRHQSIN